MASGEIGHIYLIHFERPYRHARHYLGWAAHLTARIAHHRNGSGARLLQVVGEAGIDWDVVRTWRGTRVDEARLKSHKNNVRMCPVCAAAKGIHLARPKLEEVRL